MEKRRRLIVHNTNSFDLYELKQLKRLQGDYKKLSPKNLTKLINSFDEHGFSFPVKIWTDKSGINWIIAGHQRLKALQKYNSCIVVNYTNTEEGLVEISRDEYDKVMIPCDLVRAKDRTEAVKLLLMEDSRFGETDKATEFFEREGLKIEDAGSFAIQDLDFGSVDMSMDINDLDKQMQSINDDMSKLNEDKAEEEAKSLEEANMANVTQDMDKPRPGNLLSDEAKMKHAREIVNLTFTIPREYAEELEKKLAQVPITMIGREKEQYLRGRRLLKELLGVEIKPI